MAVDPNDDVGTTLRITAADILEYTDADNELWILGSPGDVVQLDRRRRIGLMPTARPQESRGPLGRERAAKRSRSIKAPTEPSSYIENEVQAQFTP